MVGIQLPYGLKDGTQPVHISEVPTGLACGCSCPQCGKRLVAKKGRLVVHHFAHYATQAAQCTWATESALHRLAKDILAGEKAIWLPATPLLLPGIPRARDEGWFPYEDARLEERINDVRADLLLANDAEAVMVEIAVSHFCNEAKIQKIEAAGVSAIEINLSGFDLFDSDLDLRSALLKEAPRTWLFHTNGYRKPIEAKEEPQAPDFAAYATDLSFQNRRNPRRRTNQTTRPRYMAGHQAPRPWMANAKGGCGDRPGS